MEISLKNQLNTLPYKPGCYIFRDKSKSILYIGKAVNLRNRVSSYFRNYKILDPKIKIMIDLIDNLEIIITDTEIEALILESNLIKKYKPKYNRLMKDDKNYIWIKITSKEDFPIISTVRETKDPKGEFFGPYPSTDQIKSFLKKLRSVFKYRTCSRKIKQINDNSGKTIIHSSNKIPCLYFHLGLCDAPCTTELSKDLYRKNIRNIRSFLKGRKNEIITRLTREMVNYSSNRQFEQAGILRDRINELKYITQRMRIEKDMDEKMFVIYKQKQNNDSLKTLFEKLEINIENNKNIRIECYDISNISGKLATGSMVVYTDGKPLKSYYRKFKIKTKDTPDDYLMIKEIFFRRFNLRKSARKKEDTSFNTIPNLIIIDGGKGQLNAAKDILKLYNLNIPIIGLAKKNEEIFKLKDDKFIKVELSNKSTASYLIQSIRDEAHRFAIGYHKKLRSKNQIQSVLDQIPGVGELTRKKLLKAFGNVENIKKTSSQELLGVIKNRRTIENIRKILG